MALLFALLACHAQERGTMAITGFSVNFLREKPDYTAELGTQALMGTPVEVVGAASYWKQVVTPEPYTAWCTGMGLTEMSRQEYEDYLAAPKYICTTLYSRIYSGPDRKSECLSDFVEGCIVRISLDKRRKPVFKAGFAEIVMPSGEKGYVNRKDVRNFREWALKAGADPDNIIGTAMKYLGIPYMWGGSSCKGFDCSGLTRTVWFMNGVLLPRNASAQAGCGEAVEIDADFSAVADSPYLEQEMRRRIARLSKGDLIFFGSPADGNGREKITHVGIYIGNGKFIHSSQTVRINSLIPSDRDYYENSFKLIRARRIAGTESGGSGTTPILQSKYYFSRDND